MSALSFLLLFTSFYLFSYNFCKILFCVLIYSYTFLESFSSLQWPQSFWGLSFVLFFEICNLEDQVFPIRYFSVIAPPYSFFIRFSYEGKYSEQPYSASATGAAGDWQGSGVSGSGGRPRTRVRTQGKHPLLLRRTETFLGMKASGSGPHEPSL